MTSITAFIWGVSVLLIAFYTPLQMMVASVARKVARHRFRRLLQARDYALVAIGFFWVLSIVISSALLVSGEADRFLMILTDWPPLFAIPIAIVTGGGLYGCANFVLRPLVTRVLQKWFDTSNYTRSQREIISMLQLYTEPRIIALMLLTNIFEEVLFRGIFITHTGEVLNSTFIAMMLSAFTYGTYHYAVNPRDALIHGLNGWVYAVLFVYFGLWSAVIAHLVYNAFTIYGIQQALARMSSQQQKRQLFR